MNEKSTAVPSVQEWAQEFLAISGAIVEADASRRHVDVLIPEPLSTRLGSDFVQIPIGPDIGAIPDPLSTGSPFLERLMEEALTKGRSARWHLWVEIKKTLSLEDVTRKASFHGARPKSLSTKVVYVPHPLLHFQVSYISDDKQEEVVPVLVHPFLGRTLPAEAYGSAIPAQGNELGLEEIPLPPLSAVYETAQTGVELLTYEKRAFYQEREQKRFEREARRVKEYFAAARKDLERRLAREGLVEEKKKPLSAKIRVLEAEEKRKLVDLEEKHRLLVQFRLVNVAEILVPQICGEVTIEGRGLSEPSVLTVFWDPILKETLLPSCPLCQSMMTRIAICPRCRKLVCADDVGRCS